MVPAHPGLWGFPARFYGKKQEYPETDRRRTMKTGLICLCAFVSIGLVLVAGCTSSPGTPGTSVAGAGETLQSIRTMGPRS